MDWFKWFGRWGERDRYSAMLTRLRELYGMHGERVIGLSARTDLARKAAGSTQRAFEFVERAFVEATQEYARIGPLLDGLEAGLARAVVGDFAGAEKALQGLGPTLDELERHLNKWEAIWQQVPRQIEEAETLLAEVCMQVEAAAAGAGAPLPLSDRLASLAQHLERTKRTLAGGNPVEAGHLIDDFRIALRKVSDEAQTYIGGAGAISQAEQDVARTRELVSNQAPPSAGAMEALTAAAAILPRLRPNLVAGKLEQFQEDLLQLQRHLSAARAARKT
jgi:hypothetical protein